MTIAKLLSSDSHVVEPPDLWATRLEPKFRDRAPHVVQEDDGDWWIVDGQRTNSFQGGAQAGKRFEHHDEVKPAARFAEVRPGAYLPEAHLVDNEADGVYGSVLYPTEGLTLYGVPDSDLLTAVFRVYNDWIAEFCQAAPQRLKGIAMINVDDIPGAIKELERTRARGLVGAMIAVYPAEERSYDRPEYEPFWAAAQDLDMPLSLHIATNRPSPGMPLEDNRRTRPALLANADHWVRVSLGASDLHRRLGALSASARRHRGARAQLGAAFPAAPRLHVHPTRQARLVVPLSGQHAAERFLPPQRLSQLPGRPLGHQNPDRRRELDVGVRLPAHGSHVPTLAADPGADFSRGARGGTGKDHLYQRRTPVPL